MQQALACASQAMFSSAPNPRVGCVLVKNQECIGIGFTQPVGNAHAEVMALNDAAQRGHDASGATAYVTLEPCSHYGRTPPCAHALINAKVSRVVVAIEDPNPLVAGQGIAMLRNAGIEVAVGILKDQAYELNIGFFSRMQRGKPWVRVKIAASIDGKTALPNGRSQWITSEAARNNGHWWRARACAILTGIGTVKSDNPYLNVRAFETPRQPLRIVVDSRLEIDPQANLLKTGGVIIATARDDSPKIEVLRQRGCEILILPNADGKVDLSALMRELGRRQINELHVEAGHKLNGSLLRDGCVDELLIYLAPRLLGVGHAMLDLPALTELDATTRLSFQDMAMVGPDIRLLARLI